MSDVSIKYPALYKSSDSASTRSQNFFINLNRVNLISLILASICSSLSAYYEILTNVAGILLVITLVLTSLMFYIKFEKKWYEGRAIAESIKTLSWKFMMGAEPFSHKFNLKDAEARLLKYFRKIIGQKKDFFQLIGGDFASDDQITNEMRTVRSQSFEAKRRLYSKNRLEEQIKWYAEKSNENKRYKRISFIIILFLIILSIACLFIDSDPQINIITTPITVSIALAIIAWMQLKGYQELTQSYSVAANELGTIKSKLHHVMNEDEFSEFVDDSETAISREHTLWLARRDNIELFD